VKSSPPWPVWIVFAITAALAVHIVTKSNGHGQLPVSRG
jgi:hypothetical protein